MKLTLEYTFFKKKQGHLDDTFEEYTKVYEFFKKCFNILFFLRN